MSTNAWSERARAAIPGTGAPRPHLSVVAKPGPQAPRLPFVLFVMVLLMSGLVGLLLLNTGLQRGAYVATELRQVSAALEVRRELLETKVGVLQEPQRLAQEAIALGMVQNDSPAFLSLAARGSILGKPIPADATNQFEVETTTPGGAGTDKAPAQVAGSGTSLAAALVTVPRVEPPKPDPKPQEQAGQGRG
ncbi:MAG: hypothetical protein H0T14_02125 [Nocardioidaceae bacterium]|nr:hypothetical protein [Nocardioidaceae bacterium]